MKKPVIDVLQTIEKGVQRVLMDIKENVEIITGRRGGAILPSLASPAPSVGLAVNTAAATLVTLKTEFDVLVIQVNDIQAKLNALIARLNTP